MFLAKVRSTGDIALAVVSSGIAAILLQGGRTAHSRSKIPINIHSEPYCSIKAQSGLAELIRQAKVILWDVAPMHHRYVAEAVERTLRDIREPDKPFGGVVMVFAGKFFHCYIFPFLNTFQLQATFDIVLLLYRKALALKLLTHASTRHHFGAEW